MRSAVPTEGLTSTKRRQDKYKYEQDEKGYKEKCEGPNRTAYRSAPRAHRPVAHPKPVPAVTYSTPFGIDTGRCNRELMGAVRGAVAGGVDSSSVSQGSERTATTIGGAVIGVSVGGQIGSAMDENDHYCVGQIFEHARDNRAVRWCNVQNDLEYRVTPSRTYRDGQGRHCREYYTSARNSSRSEQRVLNAACRAPEGAWRLVNRG